jgi:superfamily I DNA/RNA helicase
MEDTPFPCTWKILLILFIHINLMIINTLWEVILFLREPYLGKHTDCDRWLNNNKGFKLALNPDSKTLVDILVSDNVEKSEDIRSAESDFSEGKLHQKVKERYFKSIADQIPYSQLKPFLEFESDVDDDVILECCLEIKDEEVKSAFMDVFLFLRAGEIDEAKNRILLFEEFLKLLEDTSFEEKKAIVSSDHYVNLDELEGEYLKGILESRDWYDWMLFLHPAQRIVVDTDYKGPARLLGVSGSGKTCVLVHRAVRLAKKYPGEQILILTLNPALSRLINELISVLLENRQEKDLASYIKVSSFWEMCKDLLIEFDGHPLRSRILSPKTDRHEETIDEVWQEFYQCEKNNEDAEILLPIHQTLLVRKIFPMAYMKQEFDWVRSAFSEADRKGYLVAEREGRKVPIIEQDRLLVLEGLEKWNKKMEDVGAIDYLGLANRLFRHIAKVIPTYKSILVDEIQDFGTIELSLIRKLVKEGENDLFLVGDIAQQVYNKHHQIRKAGIQVPSSNYLKILKNYRNSREILEASYAMFQANIDVNDLNTDDFEVLNPEYANFSSPKPFLRSGKNLENEFFSALYYLNELLDLESNEKACIALCGFTIFEVAEIAQKLQLPTLDGENDLSGGTIFLSDLEQTKGFEFDRMVIVNCNLGVFPDPKLPGEEWYREISKIYVAMTRAKKELVVSYSDNLSAVYNGQEQYYRKDTWQDHVYDPLTDNFPLTQNKQDAISQSNWLKLKGKTFLYSQNAIGISRELQAKLIDLVKGVKSFDDKNNPDAWPTMGALKKYLEVRPDIPSMSRLFGPVVFEELMRLLCPESEFVKQMEKD